MVFRSGGIMVTSIIVPNLLNHEKVLMAGKVDVHDVKEDMVGVIRLADVISIPMNCVY